MKNKIRVFATDGESIWELLFITQNKKGDFYLGKILPGFNGKFSRHSSGKTHFKSNKPEMYSDLGLRKKITEFEGIESQPRFTFTKNSVINQHIGRLFQNQLPASYLLIDITNYESLINLMIFLIDSSRIEQLKDFQKRFQNSRLEIFKQTKPWIAIMAFSPS